MIVALILLLLIIALAFGARTVQGTAASVYHPVAASITGVGSHIYAGSLYQSPGGKLAQPALDPEEPNRYELPIVLK